MIKNKKLQGSVVKFYADDQEHEEHDQYKI